MTEKKPAPKSSAERQATYRRRLKTDDENRRQRLNVVVSLRAKLNLEVLAAHYGTTKQEALERALAAAEEQALAHLISAEITSVSASAIENGQIRYCVTNVTKCVTQ